MSESLQQINKIMFTDIEPAFHMLNLSLTAFPFVCLQNLISHTYSKFDRQLMLDSVPDTSIASHRRIQSITVCFPASQKELLHPQTYFHPQCFGENFLYILPRGLTHIHHFLSIFFLEFSILACFPVDTFLRS